MTEPIRQIAKDKAEKADLEKRTESLRSRLSQIEKWCQAER